MYFSFVTTLLLMKGMVILGRKLHFLSNVPVGKQTGLLFLHLLHWGKGERQHFRENKPCLHLSLKLHYCSGIRNVLIQLRLCRWYRRIRYVCGHSVCYTSCSSVRQKLCCLKLPHFHPCCFCSLPNTLFVLEKPFLPASRKSLF